MVTVNVPWVDGLTIGQTLRMTAERLPDQPAVIFTSLNVRRTWREFDQEVDQTAKSLLGLGFQKGDHFGVWAANCPGWLHLQFATARLGIVLVTVNPGYQPAELRYAITQSRLRGLAVLDHFKTTDCLAMLEQLFPALQSGPPGDVSHDDFPDLRWLISLGERSMPGILSWQEFLDHGKSTTHEKLALREQLPTLNEHINIQYTSGTTALPKGAISE